VAAFWSAGRLFIEVGGRAQGRLCACGVSVSAVAAADRIGISYCEKQGGCCKGGWAMQWLEYRVRTFRAGASLEHALVMLWITCRQQYFVACTSRLSLLIISSGDGFQRHFLFQHTARFTVTLCRENAFSSTCGVCHRAVLPPPNNPAAFVYKGSATQF
jgi:hypothetical protein